jgi:zinc protease
VVRLGWLVPDRGDPDIPILRTLATALGHDASGRLGVLYRSLRIDRGETYGVQSFVWPLTGASEFVVTTSIERDRLADALRELFSAIERVRTRPIDDHELPATQSLVDMLTWRSLETSRDMVNALTPVGIYNDPLDAFYARLRALGVSAETLRAMAKRYLVPESRVIVVVGDATYVRPALAQVGLTDVLVRPLNTASR